MSDYGIIYGLQLIALIVASGMIAMARKGFNGFAFGVVALGLLLIVRRVEDMTHLIGEPGMAMVSSLVIAFYCWITWSIWKDRHDHRDYLHWREEQAEELRLMHKWQARRMAQQEKIAELERERSKSPDDWDVELPRVTHTQQDTRMKVEG